MKGDPEILWKATLQEHVEQNHCVQDFFKHTEYLGFTVSEAAQRHLPQTEEITPGLLLKGKLVFAMDM